ncbi:hypothetical protein GCM10007386_04670 [Pseudoduganella dura]|nr:hypothetical protein GCM10007386_04670 [Pseudoduganella dura]
MIQAALLSMLRRSRSEIFVVAAGETLPDTALRLMRLLFRQYRQHPRLMRALSRYLDSD